MSSPTNTAGLESVEEAHTNPAADESEFDGLETVPLNISEILLLQYFNQWTQRGVDKTEYRCSFGETHFKEQVDVQGLVTDRPWLLPTNRKLRHLQGISVRNMSFDKPRESLRRVYDADGVFLGVTNSVADPNTASEAPGDGKASSDERLDGVSSSRPSVGSMRRRSTLSWGNVAPDVRQKKLEEVTGSRLADVFFTIFDAENKMFIYVSETVEKTMNPDFKFFDLRDEDASFTRSSELRIDLWAKPQSVEKLVLVGRMNVDLRSLRWVGKALADLTEPLPPNCVLFHLTDGIYTTHAASNPALDLFQFLPPSTLSGRLVLYHHASGQKLFSACYDILSKLKLVAECVDDTIFVQHNILVSIERSLTEQILPSKTFCNAATETNSLGGTQNAINETKRVIAVLEKQLSGISSSNSSRRSLIGEGRVFKNKVTERQSAELTQFDSKKSAKEDQFQETRGHIRRVVHTLGIIFPITPIDDRPLCFEICGQFLPNADDLYATGKSTPTEQGIAAALGYVASCMTELADIVGFPFPYPVISLGSNSTIEDPITISPNPSGSSSAQAKPKRVFPLYQISTKRPDFEYAVYLLNQDLLGLMATESLRIVNPKTTLANLKYLMEVLTSGKGDVPERKKGKVALEAVGVSQVNVGGEIINEGPRAAEDAAKLDDDFSETPENTKAQTAGSGAAASGSAPPSWMEVWSASPAVTPLAPGAGKSTASPVVQSTDSTTLRSNGKGKGKASENGQGTAAGQDARTYIATAGDEHGFDVAGPSPAVVQTAQVKEKLDGRTLVGHSGPDA